jgi:hypothetical protein
LAVGVGGPELDGDAGGVLVDGRGVAFGDDERGLAGTGGRQAELPGGGGEAEGGVGVAGEAEEVAGGAPVQRAKTGLEALPA